MENIENILEDFKNLKINKKQLQEKVGEDLFNIKISKPIVVNNKDIIYLLEYYRDEKISLDDLIDWVNVVWFSDLYGYDERYEDSIASIMSILEELDEEGHIMTKDDIEKYIDALKNNLEI